MSLIVCVCVCVCVCVWFFWLIFNFFLNIHILAKFQHLVTKKQNWDCAYILQRILFLFLKKWHKFVIILGEKKT